MTGRHETPKLGTVGSGAVSMKIDVKVLDGPPKVAVIKAEGYIEAVQSRLLRERLKQLEKEGVRRVVIDLERVMFISSSGLSVLIAFVTEKKEQWGAEPVILVKPTPTVMESIRTLGLEPLFSIADDEEAALKRYGLQ